MLNSFACHHLQNDFYHKNETKIESNVSSFTIFSCSAFSSAFAAHVASFVLKSKNFIRLEI